MDARRSPLIPGVASASLLATLVAGPACSPDTPRAANLRHTTQLSASDSSGPLPAATTILDNAVSAATRPALTDSVVPGEVLTLRLSDSVRLLVSVEPVESGDDRLAIWLPSDTGRAVQAEFRGAAVSADTFRYRELVFVHGVAADSSTAPTTHRHAVWALLPTGMVRTVGVDRPPPSCGFAWQGFGDGAQPAAGVVYVFGQYSWLANVTVPRDTSDNTGGAWVWADLGISGHTPGVDADSAGTPRFTVVRCTRTPFDDRPTAPHIVRNACPFECCRYGKWVFGDTVLVRVAPWDTAAVMHTILPGTGAQADSGHVVLVELGAAVVTRRGSHTRQGLQVGDTLWILDYEGEGSYRAWARGRSMGWDREYPYRDLRLLRYPRQVWWVHVTRSNGASGWVNMDDVRNVDGYDACG